MKRNELQNELKKLGFKQLCNDKKTLVIYNQIQGFLYANKTPLKDIKSIYTENGFLYVVLIGGAVLECGEEETEEE